MRCNRPAPGSVNRACRTCTQDGLPCSFAEGEHTSSCACYDLMTCPFPFSLSPYPCIPVAAPTHVGQPVAGPSNQDMAGGVFNYHGASTRTRQCAVTILNTPSRVYDDQLRRSSSATVLRAGRILPRWSSTLARRWLVIVGSLSPRARGPAARGRGWRRF